MACAARAARVTLLTLGTAVTAVTATIIATGDARADDADAAGDGRSHTGVAVYGVLPVDGWRAQTGAGGGATAWLEVPVTPHLEATARAGVIVHAPATVTLGARVWLVEVPVLGGARLEVVRAGRVRGLLGGDVGLVVAHERVTLAGVTEGETRLRFGADLVAGVALDPVAIEVGPWLADLADLDHAVGFAASVSLRLRSW